MTRFTLTHFPNNLAFLKLDTFFVHIMPSCGTVLYTLSNTIYLFIFIILEAREQEINLDYEIIK